MASPGLINLQTDLKSLRYGSDTPYVTKDINNPPSSNQVDMQITKRVDDLTRIGKMLIDRPGLKFLGNQALLQQVNIQDKLQKNRDKGKSLAGAIVKQGLETVKQTAKIVGSTLAQVPVNGTGTHFVYAFRTDTYLQPSGRNTTSAFAQFFGAGGVEGAPLALRGEEISGKVQSNFGKENEDGKFEVTAESKLDYDTYLNTPQQNRGAQIYAQAGKPIYAGPTTPVDVNIAGATVTLNAPLQKDTTASPGSLGISNQNVTGSYKGPIGTVSGSYIDKQSKRDTKNGNVLKENRILLGDQGARKDENKSNNIYWTTSATKAEIDKLNAQAPVTAKVNGEEEGRDIVKFRFHVITPTETKVLYFRAFLDNFSDNYTGQWNPTKYLGRGEDFQVYGGFQRKISLSFKIAAATRSEMKPLYQKMIYLASSTAPTYADNGQFMRGTIVKMTVGDYIYELPGVMNSVNYSWNVEYPWEIAMLEPEGEVDTTMQELPMVMDCSIDFTPIHTFTPETGLKKYFTAGTNGNNSFIE